MRLYLTRIKDQGNWYIRGTDREGGKVFESTKTTNKAAAEALRVKKESELLKESVYGKKTVVNFDEAADSYIEDGGSSRFLGEFKDGSYTGLVGKFTGWLLKDINQVELDRVAKELHPDVLPETLNRCVYTPFIAVWNHAVGKEWADYRKWKRPSSKKKGTLYVRRKPKRAGTTATNYETAATFVLSMSPANAIVSTILFYTGMRPIELFTMDCDQVNVRARWITLPESKTGEPRGIPIHNMLVPLLTDLVKRGGKLVRTYLGEPYTVVEGNGGQMKKAITTARKKTGILGVSPYTARHTVSTQLVINGIHPYVKDQIIGHVSDEMSRLYTHVPQKELIKAINTLPTIPRWRAASWMTEPVKLTTRRNPPKFTKKKAPRRKRKFISRAA